MSFICHPEASLFEAVRISSFQFFFIKTLKGWDSHVAEYAPQNDRVGGWDSRVVQSKSPDSSE